VNAQLTSEQKDSLLYLHRKTRDAVGASNMQTLYWSSTLASEAQAYAEKCVGLNHSGVMGENLATATYNNVERLYHLWEDEREIFEESDSYRKKFPGYHSFGHYTQIVWAANTKVGCGQAYCKNLSQPYNLVCRY
ncbi:PR-1-like protein, partial [Piromyces finnis]